MVANNSGNLRIAIFVEGEFIPSYSGAANRFHYLSKYLQEANLLDVIVVLCDRGWSDIDLIRQESFTTYLLNPEDFYYNYGLITEIIIKENVQVIQFASLEGCIFQGLEIAYRTNTHLILEAHYEDQEFARQILASDERQKYLMSLQNDFGKAIDGVIYLSHDDKSALQKYLQVADSRMYYSPSGADTKELSPLGVDPKSNKIVFLGNLYFSPNQEAIEMIYNYIYPHLSPLGFTFYIGGDVPEYLSDRFNSSNFIFTGQITNLNEFFKNSFVALSPISSGPGMRIKILNYLAAGVPVISTSAGAAGFPEKDLLIICDEIELYPQAILKLKADEEKHHRVSIQGRRFIEEQLSWTIIANRLAKDYERIIARRRIEKRNFINKVTSYSHSQPAWLEEIIMNGRFQFQRCIVEKGKVQVIKPIL